MRCTFKEHVSSVSGSVYCDCGYKVVQSSPKVKPPVIKEAQDNGVTDLGQDSQYDGMFLNFHTIKNVIYDAIESYHKKHKTMPDFVRVSPSAYSAIHNKMICRDGLEEIPLIDGCTKVQMAYYLRDYEVHCGLDFKFTA